MKIDKSFMQNMDSRKRVNLIHSLSGFSPAVLVGSINKEGQENLAIFNSLIHLGSNPALFGLKFRPHTVPRHTLENILETEYFTINHVHQNIIDAAHQCSAKYDRDLSEFIATGLTACYDDNFRAPFVKESSVKMGMRYLEHHLIKANGTLFLVAELLYAEIDDLHQNEQGSILLDKMDVVVTNGLYNYYKAQPIKQKQYAKPE